NMAAFWVTGCGGANSLTKSPGTTTTQLTGSNGSSSSISASSTTPVAGTSNPGTTTSSSSAGSGSGTPVAGPTPTPTPVPPTPSNNGDAPPPPAGAIIMANVQNQGGWQTCGGCGNDGGGGTAPAYGLTQAISTPSLSGSSTDFWITGGPAYTGGY